MCRLRLTPIGDGYFLEPIAHGTPPLGCFDKMPSEIGDQWLTKFANSWQRKCDSASSTKPTATAIIRDYQPSPFWNGAMDLTITPIERRSLAKRALVDLSKLIVIWIVFW